MARLTVRRGPQTGAVYPLTADQITIGRGTRNDIVIDDNDVSREHCRLRRSGSGYQVEDLNSTHGTFINGQRVNDRRGLLPGSMLELGDMVTLQYDGAAPDAVDETPAITRPTTSTDTYYLVLESTARGTEKSVFTLSTPKITLGRDLSNDIVIQDPEISRWHLHLLRQSDGYVVEDLNSTNGTQINGRRLTEPRRLTPHDILGIGTGIRLYFVTDINDTQDAASPSPSNSVFTVDYTPQKLVTDEMQQAAPIIPIGAPNKRQTSRLGTGLREGALQDHVLISYNRDAWEDLVAPMMVALQDAGIRVWVDQYLTPESDDWRAAVQQAVAECWLLVLVLSPSALDTREVKLEYRYFINREKPVIGFEHHPMSSLPPELENLKMVRYDPQDSRRSFQRLIFEILQKRA